MGNDSLFCYTYIDDILVDSDNIQQHIRHLQQVFVWLCFIGLLIHPKKCQFAEPSVLYLGHIVSKDGILQQPEPSNSFRSQPLPRQ